MTELFLWSYNLVVVVLVAGGGSCGDLNCVVVLAVVVVGMSIWLLLWWLCFWGSLNFVVVQMLV